MGVLAEYLKTEGEHLRAERQQRKDVVEEWKESLERLYQNMCEWLEAADGGQGLIGARADHQHMVEEPRLGAYWTKKLTVLMGAFESGIAVPVAEVVPRARFVVAEIHPTGREPRRADGMVEIREGKIAGHYLFRGKTDGGDEWFICTVSAWNNVRGGEHGRVEPLTAESFEAAVLSAIR